MKQKDKAFPQFHIHDQAQSVRTQFMQAIPVIAAFLVMFYSVIFLFGTEYTMIVSLGTLVFQVNYKKQHTPLSLILLLGQHIFLLVLAYVATWNLALSLLLNLAVPFWLIFTKSSQFNQLGYFSSLMTFTFLQFFPMDWTGFLIQLQTMLFCCVFVFAAILIYSRIFHNIRETGTEQKAMVLLGNILEKKLNSEDVSEELGEFFCLQRTLYQEAYSRRGKRHIVNSEGKLKYMFAILIQRSAYFISGQNSAFSWEDEEDKAFVSAMAAYIKKAGEKDFLNGSTKELKKEGRTLLHRAEKERKELYKTAANFFRMYLFILHQADKKDSGILDEHWEIPAKHLVKEHILGRFRPDTFEMRFALRMSVVLMTGMAFNLLFDEGHSYWFVMNTFLLLRPMYEDSKYRMRTRFLGTAAGCVLIALILPFCTSITDHLILAGIMVACMYTATPGTIIHAVFVTCFALTMTTLAMGESSAVFLRMSYVAAAVIFVLVINRFFFPTSLGSQFRYNFQMLFHMHHMYLRILENSLTAPLDYWRLCDAQIQYHMVLSQIRQDLPKTEKETAKKDYYLRILSITWRMASEIQQMIFLVKYKKRGGKEREIMEQYIYYTDYVLNQIQEMLHLKKEKKLKNIEGMKYQRCIDGEPGLSALMTQYARNLSRLYILVLRRYRA